MHPVIAEETKQETIPHVKYGVEPPSLKIPPKYVLV
jgi:hypothetical protein